MQDKENLVETEFIAEHDENGERVVTRPVEAVVNELSKLIMEENDKDASNQIQNRTVLAILNSMKSEGEDDHSEEEVEVFLNELRNMIQNHQKTLEGKKSNCPTHPMQFALQCPSG